MLYTFITKCHEVHFCDYDKHPSALLFMSLVSWSKDTFKFYHLRKVVTFEFYYLWVMVTFGFYHLLMMVTFGFYHSWVMATFGFYHSWVMVRF